MRRYHFNPIDSEIFNVEILGQYEELDTLGTRQDYNYIKELYSTYWYQDN